MNNIGCERCMGCGTCSKAFPEEYIDGGADKCYGYTMETDAHMIRCNMERKIKEIKNHYFEKGICI